MNFQKKKKDINYFKNWGDGKEWCMLFDLGLTVTLSISFENLVSQLSKCKTCSKLFCSVIP